MVEGRVYHARRSETETKPLNRRIRPFNTVALAGDPVARWGEAPAWAGVVMGEGHPPALASGRNSQAEVGHQNQVLGEVVDRVVASSVAVGVVLVLGGEVAHHQDVTGTLGQGLEERLEDGWRH